MLDAVLHPNVATLLSSITSVTGHAVAFDAATHSPRVDAHHHWEVIGRAGDRYGVLRVHAGSLSDEQHALYAQLSQLIAHEADLRHQNSSLETRFHLLDRQNAELSALNRSLSDVAYRDSLTGVYRRWYLVEQIRLELVRARRYRRPLSILMVDAEHFADVNQRFGLASGDSLLRDFAQRLVQTFRGSDVIARYAGDRFCILLADTASDGAERAERRAHAAIEEKPFDCGGQSVALTMNSATISFSAGTITNESPDGVLDMTAQRLHRVKRTSRAK